MAELLWPRYGSTGGRHVSQCLLYNYAYNRHVQRMKDRRLPKEVMKWRPPGRRKLGRPKLTWAEGIRGLMG